MTVFVCAFSAVIIRPVRHRCPGGRDAITVTMRNATNQREKR